MRAILSLMAACFLAPAVYPQDAEAHHHGIGQLGRVAFPVSCAPQARRRFEHAMTVLHSFWWDEDERAFAAVRTDGHRRELVTARAFVRE